jgi:glycosyltransferase involved in cell wall biosynthesis
MSVSGPQTPADQRRESGPGVPPAAAEVPAHVVHELLPRRTKYCVCIPVINEGERIQRQLSKMQKDAADLIIADGGSTDGSLGLELLRSEGVRALLVKTGPGRLGAQLRMGFAWALEQGYEGVVLVDGNDKDDTSAIPQFIAALEQGFDFVQGSRYAPGGQGINTPLYRHAGVTLLHAPLVSLAARRRYTDTTNGFRGYSARFLRDPRVLPLRAVFNGYELHYYLAIRAARLGFRVCELPVTRAYPASGPVPSKISPLKGSAVVLKALLSSVLGRFDP